MRRFAISDIHGCCQTLQYLVGEILNLTKSDELYLLGDYVDRGPDTKGVIDFIMDLQEEGYTVKTLCGNHEAMMLEALESTESLMHWHRNGGDTTMKSFGVTDLQRIPEKYWQFLHQLGFYLELPDYYLVHAGFNFAAENPLKDITSMLWIRNFPVDQKFLGDRRIVHGHTPTPVNRIHGSVSLHSQVINIDGGCVYKQVPGLGYLTALNLDSLELHVVSNQEG